MKLQFVPVFLFSYCAVGQGWTPPTRPPRLTHAQKKGVHSLSMTELIDGWSSHRRTKRILKFDSLPPEDLSSHIDAYIEAIPVEDRLRVLNSIALVWKKSELDTLYNSPRFTFEQKIYLETVLSSLYIEAGILRLLIRYATNEIPLEMEFVRSASQLTMVLRHLFASQNNYIIDFVTPRMLFEWYRFTYGDDKFILHVTENPTARINDTHLLQIDLRTFRKIVLRRRDQLISTGYETIK